MKNKLNLNSSWHSAGHTEMLRMLPRRPKDHVNAYSIYRCLHGPQGVIWTCKYPDSCQKHQCQGHSNLLCSPTSLWVPKHPRKSCETELLVAAMLVRRPRPSPQEPLTQKGRKQCPQSTTFHCLRSTWTAKKRDPPALKLCDWYQEVLPTKQSWW